MTARGVVRGALVAYKRFISPLLPAACRFYPSCSAFAAEAVGRHGVLRGGAMAVGRLMRCHPWSDGGFDPVPGTSNDATDAKA